MKDKEIQMDISDLKKHGYVRVRYPRDLRTSVVQAMASWQTFCTLPDEVKRAFSGGDRTNDFGYMRREDKVGTADDKELFHVLRSDLPELARRADEVHDKRAVEFIYAVDELVRMAEPVILAFAQETERHYGLKGFAESVLKNRDQWVFRYLHYMGGETLAHAHPDRAGATLHLCESTGGGEYLNFDKKWRPWPLSVDETIIFPSMVLQHLSHGVLKALYHRVTATAESRRSGRFAMVAFVYFQHTHAYNGPRLQDFEEGFNYDMPFEEFQKLFCPTT